MRCLKLDASRTNYLLVVGTGFVLLALPLLAATEELWPVLVGASVVASAALAVLWKRDPLTTRQVLWGAFLFRLALLPLLPGLTDDLYRYIWDGWLQVEGINPYRYPPEHEALAAFQDTFLYEQLNSKPYYSIYPPFTQLFFAVGGWFYSIDWTVSYYVLKGLFMAVEFSGVFILSRLTSARNLLLYAWNPLVLIETAGQGHTEALLIFFLAGLLWAVRRKSGRVASIAVAGAGLVKLYPFVLWPFLIRRFGWASVWSGILFITAVSLPYAAPYTLPHMKASVDLFAYLMEFNAGLYYLVKYIAWLLTGADWSKVIGPAFRAIFLGSLPILYYLDWYRDWSFRSACLLTLSLFLVLSTTVHPWYVVPPLLVAVLDRRAVWIWSWVATWSIGTYLFYVDGPYWLWIWIGWGGAAGLGSWLYQTELRALGRWLRAQIARRELPVSVGATDVQSDS